MINKTLPFAFFIVIITFSSCSKPLVKINNDVNLKETEGKFAILTFEHNGAFLSSRIAENATDYFNSRLFTKNHLDVVDRSLVKNVVNKYEIKSHSQLSKQEIKRISAELQADYIVLGTLNSLLTMDQYYSTNKKKFELIIRILESNSGDIIVLAEHKKSGDGNTVDLVYALVADITGSLK